MKPFEKQKRECKLNGNSFYLKVGKVTEVICRKYGDYCKAKLCLNERRKGGVSIPKRCNCITNAVSNQSIEVHMKRGNQHLT